MNPVLIWLGLIVHPCRRRNRNSVGLEVYCEAGPGISTIWTFPVLPKDIAFRCLCNTIHTHLGDEVEYGVLLAVVSEMIAANVHHIQQ